MEARNRLLAPYLIGFTGQVPTEAEIADLRAYADALDDPAAQSEK